MKKQGICAIAAMAACMTTLLGCSIEIPETAREVSSISRAAGRPIIGRIIGETGKLYYARDFSFTVNHIRYVPEYAGYIPSEGCRLLDVSITENGISDGPAETGTYHFYILNGSDGIWPLDPADDSMMPPEFELGKDESVTYHMLYEIPENADALKLIYIETDNDGNVDNMFTINVKPED